MTSNPPKIKISEYIKFPCYFYSRGNTVGWGKMQGSD